MILAVPSNNLSYGHERSLDNGGEESDGKSCYKLEAEEAA